ncbi:uncharacterized protein OCT59_025390 [Rhizophagus irregularis]|uniref:Uncharacterized protein n=2 Tax=Rhizophagus irregularis TaxID=588596 RepID=A0A015LEC1_RHIIW|nr:hypothetical protein GLOIN_2v1762563 [Rhizophagus irregularis DAOM 181602=DAOM 197198]EXX53133.1 hypothetical protein RirG_246820 [Rhizophagus irregularis DAOM 197198w]POG82008.1 hypothetical protein GLOIN_2v1762563 [Rhizophagus irregularis DAOM 181602=DAOM 197198]UZO05029.1 hypothetical protein OCT59_025390 [Rhizophagus irregularis]GBC11566.1 hypothetical protein GLOIN_2v1762563 [Rhizophagus irregularis DAOM 181602=DAOM 197198]|eukprot:XP_025188874.1 hypothetical protein GLOIN_2v1762563 [Rhizophagus irregularis DAOM 181602=DAOM 197198]
MESIRTLIKIAENNFQTKVYEQEIYLVQVYQSFINYFESLASSFFTGRDTEVQCRIIQNNFSLNDKEINSWEGRASCYKMTPESFTFFLHIAMLSASEGLIAAEDQIQKRDETLSGALQQEISRQKEAERLMELIPGSYKKSKSKKLKKSKKSKKKISKFQLDSSHHSESEGFDNDVITFEPRGEVDSDNQMDDDRDLNIDRSISKTNVDQNRTIAELSGTQPNVDHSLMEITSVTITLLIIDVTPQPQQVTQQEITMTNLTKSSNKKKKSNKTLIQNVITGHTLTDDDASRVRDILVYDVLVSWTPEDILKELTLWEKTISLQTKPQRKYQTLHLKIELSTFRLAQFEVNDNPVHWSE